MKKTLFYTLALSLIATSFPVYAELPNPATTRTNQFGNGAASYNNNGFNQGGYNQFNYPSQYGSGGGNAAQYGNGGQVQKVYNTAMTAKDILWVFTGNESSFGKRLFYVFSGALERRYLAPIENKIGNLEYNRQTGAVPTQTAQNPYMNQGAQYCYECAQQNNTNPYAQNQNAINPAIFNNSSSTSAGGLKK
jgi:hypothetical protein